MPAKVTQRIVLSQVSSVFDPLGLFSPFTVRLRLLLKGIGRNMGNRGTKKFLQKTRLLSRIGHRS